MQIELIPRERRWKLQRRAAMASWVSGLSLLTLAAIVWVAVSSARIGSPDEIRTQAADLETALVRAQRSESAAQGELLRALTTLEANRAASSQLDWSRLLTAVTDARSADVVLGRFRLSGAQAARETSEADPASGRATGSGGIRLDLQGYGRTSQAVAAYVLALEATRLFDQVRQVDTRREPIATGTVIAFRIECLILDDEEESGA